MNTIKLITLTNFGYKEFTENSLKSLSLLNFDLSKIIIYTLDNESYKYFSKKYKNITCKQTNNIDLPNLAKYQDSNWNKLTIQKIKIVYEELKQNDYLLLFDGDIVFENSKFIEYCYNELISDNLDIICQNEWKDNNNDKLCTGFYLLKSTENTIKCFDVDLLNTNENDQSFLNRRKHMLRYKLLPIEKFPNGKYYYEKNPSEPYIIHFNFVFSHDKENKMKMYNKWYI